MIKNILFNETFLFTQLSYSFNKFNLSSNESCENKTLTVNLHSNINRVLIENFKLIFLGKSGGK